MIFDLIRSINLFLAIMVILLTLNLVISLDRVTGFIIYSLDFSEPICYFYNFGKINQIPKDFCCYQLQKLLECSIANERFYKCYVSENSERYYLLNQKMLNYCKIENYHVPKVK